MIDRERDYHRERARTELDQAYRATHLMAAEAHMRLSALHMSRLREMDAGDSAAGMPAGMAGS